MVDRERVYLIVHYTSVDQLTRHFQKFGEVSVASIAFVSCLEVLITPPGNYTCVVLQDWETGFSRGFGFVQFKDDSAASAALRVSHEISGTKVNSLNAVPTKCGNGGCTCNLVGGCQSKPT